MIPEEIKETVSALDNNTRWGIVELLLKNNRLSYTELLKKLNVQKGALSHHLNKLMEGGVLDNFSGEQFSGPYTSYYELSYFGKEFLENSLSTLKYKLPCSEARITDNKFLKEVDQCNISKDFGSIEFDKNQLDTKKLSLYETAIGMSFQSFNSRKMWFAPSLFQDEIKKRRSLSYAKQRK